MYNSKFTEAARSSIKKNPLKSVIYKANSSSRRIHLQETVGFNQLNFWGKRKEATPGHHTSRCIVRQPRGKRLEAKAGHLVSKNWWCLFFLKKKCSRQEKGNWDRVLLWERMYKKPVSLIHLAKWALWGYRTVSFWNTFKSDVPKQAFAGTYLNDIFHSL